MRVLFATPVPPLRTRPRPHYFIRGLAQRGHAVHLLTQVPSERAAAELAGAPGWREIVEACSSIDWVVVSKARSYLQCAASLPTRTPLRVAYCSSPKFTERAWRLVQQHDCDVLHADRERIAPAFDSLPIPRILDATDSITLYLRRTLRQGPATERLVSAMELLKIPAFEGRMAEGYSACLVTSDEDAQALRTVGLRGRLEVLPNGVDARLFDCTPGKEPNSLLFVGQMYYAPNVDAAVWFTKNVLPRVRAVKPTVKLYLVGYKPRRAVRRLARSPGVEVTGWVRDVAPYLERAAAFVAATRVGGGFPNKIAEALAAGVPVVATPEAHAGIPGLVAGTHLLEATKAGEFAEMSLRLLDDAPLRDRLGNAGRAFMRVNYDWDDITKRLEDVLRGCLR